MKKLLLTLTALIFTTFTFSQYNLEFNRVLTFEIITNQEVVVPEGKVWKVEASNNQSTSNVFQVEALPILGLSGNQTMTFWDVGAAAGTAVWLKAGDKLNGAYSQGTSFSIIEFNLVSIGSSSTSSIGDSNNDLSGLEFNALIDIEMNSTCMGSGGSECVIGTMTVPQGKLWKIVNAANYRFNVVGNDVDINGGANVYVGGTNVQNSSADSGLYYNPGTYDVYSGVSGVSNTVLRMKIIEYNIN